MEKNIFYCSHCHGEMDLDDGEFLTCAGVQEVFCGEGCCKEYIEAQDTEPDFGYCENCNSMYPIEEMTMNDYICIYCEKECIERDVEPFP